MIAVGTPSAPSGALDLTAVLRVAEEIGANLSRDGRFRTIVMRSTVLPDQRIVDLVGLDDAGAAAQDRYVGIGW